jgi:Cu(I)/Ag(I) efflux system membrane fusion protein
VLKASPNFGKKKLGMKRPIVLILVLVALAVGGYFLIFKKEKIERGPKDKPLAIGENSGSFNQSFNNLLTAYFEVKDALVASDTTKANAAAAALVIAADSLKTDEIKDSSGVIKATAKDYAGTISGWAKGLIGEKGIEAKRSEFKMISESLWTLVRTVKFSGQKLYYQYCPMAFNDQGANWLSKEREIKNPYFGNVMLECGKVDDSLDYSIK